MDEIWKSVVGCEGSCEVSSLGRVRSLPRQRTKGGPLNPWEESGYLRVSISHKGRHTQRFVHLLVLEAFVGQCPAGMQGAHRNGNALENQLDNLRWATKPENENDKRAHGTLVSGLKCHAAKLTPDKAREIRALHGKVAQKDLAERFGVARSTIQRIQYGENWKDAL